MIGCPRNGARRRDLLDGLQPEDEPGVDQLLTDIRGGLDVLAAVLQEFIRRYGVRRLRTADLNRLIDRVVRLAGLRLRWR